MVLLDATPPTAFTSLPDYPAIYDMLTTLTGLFPGLARLGVTQLINGLGNAELPAQTRDQVRADLSTAGQARSERDELAMVPTMMAQARAVTDLGELARGERSEGAIETLRLDECVDECVDTARTYARIKDITIDTDIEPSTVLGRRDRLIRAVSNLLTNAVKFTPNGGRIMVSVKDTTVTVADSGPGIAESDRSHVFDRFWRSASARSLPGSGLGLSIVAQVVAELHGTVAVDRDPVLGGARFTIVVPSETHD